jgi:hypothetical protein
MLRTAYDLTFPGGSAISSAKLCRAYIRLLRCGKDYVTPLILTAVIPMFSWLNVEDRYRLRNWKYAHTLITLLQHPNAEVVDSASRAMTDLVTHSAGEHYAEFLEDHLFEALIERLPQPALITVNLPVAQTIKSSLTEFAASGTTWCGVLGSSSCALLVFTFFLLVLRRICLDSFDSPEGRPALTLVECVCPVSPRCM